MMTIIGGPFSRLRPALGACLTAALVLAFSGPPSGTGAGQESGQKNLGYEVTVALKLVQAYVTDKSGKAVTDLDKADFVLSVDGQPREITDFERHVLPAAKRREEPLERAPAALPSPLMNRKFIILVDLARNDHIGLKKTTEAALRFLSDEVMPSDEVAVITYKPFGGMALQANLTTNHASIRRILQQIGGIPGYGFSGAPPLWKEGGKKAAEAPALDEGLDVLSPGYDSDWESIKKKAFDFTLAMQNLAKSLRYIPGFKNIIYFSAGVPRTLLYDLEDSRVRTEYESMIKEFTSANCPVFSVNAEGQRAFLKTPASRGDHALQILSKRSGGRYFHDAAQDEKIAEAIQDMTGNFYVLGFRINEAWDGKFHEIKVEVKREGCQVFSQAGYFSPQLFRKFTKFEKELHLYDLALNDKPLSQAPLLLPLVALPGPCGEGTNLVLLSEISVESMKDVLGDEAEMVALVFDDANDLVEIRRGEVKRKSLEEPAYIPYALASLEPGPYKCRLVFRNLETGRAAVGATDITVPAVAPGLLTLSCPLILVPDRQASYLEILKQGKKEAGSAVNSLRRVYFPVSDRSSPVVNELDQGTSRLMIVAHFSAAGSGAGTPVFHASIVNESSGETIPLPLSALEIVEGKKVPQEGTEAAANGVRMNTFAADISLPGLAPGTYRLVLEAEAAEKGLKATASRDIRIK
jgi:VWFA-related protein